MDVNMKGINTLLFIFILSFSMILTSCSTKRVQSDSRRFKVSVLSDGKAQSNLDQVLIHRVNLSRSKLSNAFRGNAQSFLSKVDAKQIKDIRGSVVGLSINDSRIRSVFKLLDQDVVSSIGGKLKVHSLSDFWRIKELLEAKGSAYLVVIRNGQVNKFLYFLNG